MASIRQTQAVNKVRSLIGQRLSNESILNNMEHWFKKNDIGVTELEDPSVNDLVRPSTYGMTITINDICTDFQIFKSPNTGEILDVWESHW